MDACTTFHEEKKNWTDSLNRKKCKFSHCSAASEVKCPKRAGQKTSCGDWHFPPKVEKPPAAEPSSAPGPGMGALSPCPGYCFPPNAFELHFWQLTSQE